MSSLKIRLAIQPTIEYAALIAQMWQLSVLIEHFSAPSETLQQNNEHQILSENTKWATETYVVKILFVLEKNVFDK